MYGAPDLRLGAVESYVNLVNGNGVIADGGDAVKIGKKKHPFHDGMIVKGGVRREECGRILVEFFRERRRISKEEKKERKRLELEGRKKEDHELKLKNEQVRDGKKNGMNDSIVTTNGRKKSHHVEKGHSTSIFVRSFGLVRRRVVKIRQFFSRSKQ